MTEVSSPQTVQEASQSIPQSNTKTAVAEGGVIPPTSISETGEKDSDISASNGESNDEQRSANGDLKDDTSEKDSSGELKTKSAGGEKTKTEETTDVEQGRATEMVTAFARSRNMGEVLRLSQAGISKESRRLGIPEKALEWAYEHRFAIVMTAGLALSITSVEAANAIMAHQATIGQALSFGAFQAGSPRSYQEVDFGTWIDMINKVREGGLHDTLIGPGGQVTDSVVSGFRDSVKELGVFALATEIARERIADLFHRRDQAEKGALPITPDHEAIFFIAADHEKSNMLTTIGARAMHKTMVPVVPNRSAAEPLLSIMEESEVHESRKKGGVYLNLQGSANVSKKWGLLRVGSEHALRVGSEAGQEKSYSLVVAAAETENGEMIVGDSDELSNSLDSAITRLIDGGTKIEQAFKRGKDRQSTKVEAVKVIIANADAEVAGMDVGETMTVREKAEANGVSIVIDIKALLAVELARRIAQSQLADKRPQMRVFTDKGHVEEMHKGVSDLLGGTIVERSVQDNVVTIIQQSSLSQSKVRFNHLTRNAPDKVRQNTYIVTQEAVAVEDEELADRIISIPDLALGGVRKTQDLLRAQILPKSINEKWEKPVELVNMFAALEAQTNVQKTSS